MTGRDGRDGQSDGWLKAMPCESPDDMRAAAVAVWRSPKAVRLSRRDACCCESALAT